jgi:hypothetical protein
LVVLSREIWNSPGSDFVTGLAADIARPGFPDGPLFGQTKPGWHWLRRSAYLSTRIILAFVFFVIVSPIGLIKRMFGWDPLNRRAGASDTYWKPYPERQRDARHYEKMY